MQTFTFDTNCLIDLDARGWAAPFVETLIEAHRAGRADVAFVAVSASERQQGDCYLPTYAAYEQRLNSLGLHDIPHIAGMGYWGLSYWGRALYSSNEYKKREREIHEVLFPNIEFDFGAFASAHNLSDGGMFSRAAKKWRNAWCDRQMIWAHDFHSRDVFVTSDRNFKKLVGRSGFEGLTVCSPEEAAQRMG